MLLFYSSLVVATAAAAFTSQMSTIQYASLVPVRTTLRLETHTESSATGAAVGAALNLHNLESDIGAIFGGMKPPQLHVRSEPQDRMVRIMLMEKRSDRDTFMSSNEAKEILERVAKMPDFISKYGVCKVHTLEYSTTDYLCDNCDADNKPVSPLPMCADMISLLYSGNARMATNPVPLSLLQTPLNLLSGQAGLFLGQECVDAIEELLCGIIYQPCFNGTRLMPCASACSAMQAICTPKLISRLLSLPFASKMKPYLDCGSDQYLPMLSGACLDPFDTEWVGSAACGKPIVGIGGRTDALEGSGQPVDRSGSGSGSGGASKSDSASASGSLDKDDVKDAVKAALTELSGGSPPVPKADGTPPTPQDAKPLLFGAAPEVGASSTSSGSLSAVLWMGSGVVLVLVVQAVTLGVYLAFFRRQGGVSKPAYDVG